MQCMVELNYENHRFLDVVNEDDEVVDTRSRTDIHRLGLRHREIHVWMFDKNHNIFFQKSGLHKPSAGRLDATVSGHVNRGENYLQAAVRETAEETGIIVPLDDLVFLKETRSNAIIPKEGFLETINNFIRNVYIYKYPVNDTQIKIEEGIPGAGFQKISPALLKDMAKEDMKMVKKFITQHELHSVLKYVDNLSIKKFL